MARRASEERFLQRAEQDQTYIGVSGESYFMNQFMTHIRLVSRAYGLIIIMVSQASTPG